MKCIFALFYALLAPDSKCRNYIHHVNTSRVTWSRSANRVSQRENCSRCGVSSVRGAGESRSTAVNRLVATKLLSMFVLSPCFKLVVLSLLMLTFRANCWGSWESVTAVTHCLFHGTGESWCMKWSRWANDVSTGIGIGIGVSISIGRLWPMVQYGLL